MGPTLLNALAGPEFLDSEDSTGDSNDDSQYGEDRTDDGGSPYYRITGGGVGGCQRGIEGWHRNCWVGKGQ